MWMSCGRCSGLCTKPAGAKLNSRAQPDTARFFRMTYRKEPQIHDMLCLGFWQHK